MARIYTEGFELGFAQAFDTFTGSLLRNNASRSGDHSLSVNHIAAYGDVDIGTVTEIYVRCAVEPGGSNWGHVRFLDSDDNLIGHVRWTEQEPVEAYVNDVLVATAETILHANRWYLLEIRYKYADAGGILQVKVESQLEIDYSGDTKPFVAATLAKVRFAGLAIFDDIAINDTNGGADNSWPGDGKIVVLRPNGNGDSTQFTPSDSMADNYELVDEDIPDEDDTYVDSETSGHIDLYQTANIPTLRAGDAIQRVWAAAVAREASADGDSVQLGYKLSSNTVWGPSRVLTENYEHYKSDEATTKPGGGSWTETDVNGLQVGVRVP